MDILTINDTPGEYPASWYAATVSPPAGFPPARGSLQADVCVVGGGFAGLSTALHLARRGYSVVLLEASRLGAGASGRNGGQVGTGQRVEQPALEKQLGADTARRLWEFGLESVDLVRRLIAEGGIDADPADGIIHADHRPRLTRHSLALCEHLERVYGYPHLRFLDRAAIRSEIDSAAYHSGFLDLGGAHIHPLRYVVGLARMAADAGVRLFESSRMRSWQQRGGQLDVTTDSATITAGQVVLCLNGYHNNIDDQLASHVMPINNFIAVTAPLGEARARALIAHNHAVADSRFVINYFRLSADHRLIFGGGESYGYRFPTDIRAKVRQPMLDIFPQLDDVGIDYAWGGTLGITRSRLPHFARLQPNVLSVGGFSGHGIAMATLAGKMAAETIAGQAERFDVMAALPATPFPGGPAWRVPLLAAAMLWYGLRDRL